MSRVSPYSQGFSNIWKYLFLYPEFYRQRRQWSLHVIDGRSRFQRESSVYRLVSLRYRKVERRLRHHFRPQGKGSAK